MIDEYDRDDRDQITATFRRGHALRVPWGADDRPRIAAATGTLAEFLAGFAPTPTFGGIDELEADRQTLWVASTGLGGPLHRRLEDIAHLDGDVEGGERGLEVLAREAGVAAALADLKRVLDDALQLALRGAGLDRELPAELLGRITVRYRAIRYAPVDREVAGIGFHPDGNVLSALITDRPGLVVRDGDRVARPSADGTIVMPGSILYRWSNGRFRPTFHSVEIRRGDPTKFTIVAFLNFPDRTSIPRPPEFGADAFDNTVQRHKEDDMDRDGDLAPLWRAFD